MIYPSIRVFSGVRVTRSLVLCVCFVDGCLSFYTFSFDHCVVSASSIPITLLVSTNSSYHWNIDRSTAMDNTSGRETLYYTIRENLRSLAVLFCWVRVGTQSVVFYVVVLQMIVGLFVGFVWSLYCLYFDIRQPITLWFLQTFLLVENHQSNISPRRQSLKKNTLQYTYRMSMRCYKVIVIYSIYQTYCTSS